MFSAAASPSLRWRFVHMPAETHGSVPHRSTYDGLEFIFDGWWLADPVATYDAGGWGAVETTLSRARRRFGYEASTPPSAAFAVASGLARVGRLNDAVELVADLDADRYPFPRRWFERVVGRLDERGDADGAVAARLAQLARFPDDAAARADLVARGVTPPGPPAAADDG